MGLRDWGGVMPKVHIGNTKENHLELVWNREAGWFQLGVIGPQKFTITDGEMIREFDSLYADLRTRDDFNNLIKTVRTARNQIFGKDE
jgi:hypothetical protein